MALFNWIQENIALPAADLLSGQSISKSLDFLLDSQYWTAEKLVSFQEERLRFIIKHSFENVPFYTELFRQHNLVPSDIKILADLAKIPVITKDDLRKYPPEYYLARNFPVSRNLRLNSSGSTGEPFAYYITPEAFSMNYACALRGWYWMGYRLGDSYAKLSQNPRSGFKKKLQDRVTRSQYLFIRDLTPENLSGVIRVLNQQQPGFIRCYPDPLVFLSNEILKGKTLHYTPKAINTTGNILTPDSRKKIEKAFGAPVYDAYSCEASAQFFEGPDRKAYLASMEYAITEVIDSSGNPSGTGRHVTTDLWNLAMPFIRYDTQDIIEKSGTRQSSSIQLEAFKEIKGRNSDILLTPSGKYLIVHTFTIFFEYFEEIIQFQVHQYLPDRVKVLLVVNRNYNKTVEKAILDGLGSLMGADMHIELGLTETIPLLPSGKRKFIIRDESISLNF